MNVKDAVKTMLKARSLTQTKLAEKLDCTQGYLALMMSRDYYKDGTGYGMGAKIDTIVRICDALGYELVIQEAGKATNKQLVIGHCVKDPSPLSNLDPEKQYTVEELKKILGD